MVDPREHPPHAGVFAEQPVGAEAAQGRGLSPRWRHQPGAPATGRPRAGAWGWCGPGGFPDRRMRTEVGRMIITRSPLRISLGGGGTDLPSYYQKHTGFLLAAAIDKYVCITLHHTFTPELIIKYSK